MRLAPSPARRLLLLLLLLGGAAWVLLDGGRDRAGRFPAISRSSTPTEEPSLRGGAEEAVLRGAEKTASDAPPAAWKLTFAVFDADGTPRPWTAAAIHDREGEVIQDVEAQEGTPDNEGAVDVLGSGLLVVAAHERVPWVSDWLEPPPDRARHVDVHLQQGLAVGGVVYEQDGVTPLAGGSVRVWIPKQDAPYRPPAWREVGYYDPEGRFRVAGLPPGPLRLEVQGHDYVQGRKVAVECEAGDEDLHLVLGPQGALAFLVVDADTGLAPRTPQLVISTVTDEGESVWSQSTATVLGEPKAATPSASYLANPGQTYRFRVQAQGYEPSDVVTVAVPETGGKQVVRVELKADPASVARLSIRLQTREDALPSMLPVTRHFGGGSSNATALPVVDDRVELELMPGPVHVAVGQAWRPDPEDSDTFWVPVDVKVDLAPGEARHVEVWLERGGWVVIDGDPDPRPRQVTLRRGDEVLERYVGWGAWGKDHRTGYFLGALAPGSWTLEFAEREERRRATFQVERERVTTLDPDAFERN